jgi:5-methylcytosine-specific restriction endonuclease McrA
MSKTPRIKIPAAVRRYVLERDGHQCQSCGQTSRRRSLQIDHIIPLAQGGTNDISNLQTLCQACNAHKHKHLDPRFQRRFDY